MKPVVNNKGYAYYGSNMGPHLEGKPNPNKRHTLTVTFILDMVPGAFNQPEDLMRWIAQNPYVDTVTLNEEKRMPKFLVTASEVTFYRGTVEAESREALDEMDVEDMDLVEYDGEAMEIQMVEEVK